MAAPGENDLKMKASNSYCCCCDPSPLKEEAHHLAALAAAEARAATGPFASLWRLLSSLFRLLWLLALFTPAAVTAPLALGRGLRRREWLHMFR